MKRPLAQNSTERVSRLERDLDKARSALLSMLPHDVASLLRSYYRCKTRSETAHWLDTVVDELVDQAQPISPNLYEERARCPLCGSIGKSPFEDGYKLPEGLRRHLTGWSSRCDVVEVVSSMAREYWEEQFGEQDKAEQAAAVRRVAQRKATETLFRTAPQSEPVLAGEDRWFETPRSPEQLAWAEQRLAEIGFHALAEGNVRTYLDDRAEYVVYADPRHTNAIRFTVYRKPLPKPSNRPRLRLEPSFEIRDDWKHDIKGKYEARLANAVTQTK